jgi:hypothetical protein
LISDISPVETVLSDDFFIIEIREVSQNPDEHKGDGANPLALMNHSDSEGFFDRRAFVKNSQIYNTDVANIFSRYSVESGPVPDSKASICA